MGAERSAALAAGGVRSSRLTTCRQRAIASAPLQGGPYYPVGMPLYEYECRSCHTQFELLVREQTLMACPSCNSEELDKQLSVFAVGGDGPKFAPRQAGPSACGSCGDPRGPGACSMN